MLENLHDKHSKSDWHKFAEQPSNVSKAGCTSSWTVLSAEERVCTLKDFPHNQNSTTINAFVRFQNFSRQLDPYHHRASIQF